MNDKPIWPEVLAATVGAILAFALLWLMFGNPFK